jgi:DNA-binding response OmpR family regulator
MTTEQRQKNKRVLVVEDEPTISRVCQRVLAAQGFEVDIAMNGLIAMQMVNEKTYDLCLSDIKIPLMGGIEFYSQLTSERPELAGKIIFMSGDTLSGNTAELLKEAKRPFLPKPFVPDELLKIIRSVDLQMEAALETS